MYIFLSFWGNETRKQTNILHHTRSRAAAATILPPLSSADEKRIEIEETGSPKKSKNHGQQSNGKQTFSGLKHNG